MRKFLKAISGWANYPSHNCYLIRPEKYCDLACHSSSCIPRGQGKSYGDASLNKDATVILTEKLNRFIAFDKEQGILTAEAGITLAEILNLIVPAGWFLPVTPGTQYVSIGGCVAADVHGKNHHYSGSLGNYIIEFELITADQKKIICSPSQHAEIFWATIGGMGLTGIIGTVTLKLQPINNPFIYTQHYASDNLEQTFSKLENKNYDDNYSVAWIDCLKTGKQFGRSIIMSAHHATKEEIDRTYLYRKMATKKQYQLPFNFPSGVLNRITIRTFNELYYSKNTKNTSPYLSHYQHYFYPLDKIKYWNRFYGKKGFIQYQCVIPNTHAYSGIKQLLEVLTQHHCNSFLGVLKRLGKGNPAPLSFAIPGYTLALDMPIYNNDILSLTSKLDEIVLANHGRIYLAKDALLTPEKFRSMYPNYPSWLKIKKSIDPENCFSSSLSRRLKIGS